MGKLIATAQATLDGVVDPVGEWVQPDGDHGEHSFERQSRSSGMVLGRKTFEGLAAYWPDKEGKWAEMVNAIPKYVGSNTLAGELPCRHGPHAARGRAAVRLRRRAAHLPAGRLTPRR